MINEIDIKEFISKGEIFGFNRQTLENNIIEKLGKCPEIEDYGNKGKFLHYDNLRLSINEGRLDGIDLFLMNSDKSYECFVDNEVISISENVSLLKMLGFLNLFQIKWNIPYAKSTLDYLLIELDSGVNIFYYYEEEKIERISIFF